MVVSEREGGRYVWGGVLVEFVVAGAVELTGFSYESWRFLKIGELPLERVRSISDHVPWRYQHCDLPKTV